MQSASSKRCWIFGCSLRAFDTVAKRIRKSDLRNKGIGQYPMPVRLALEMAAHEETERQALQGRLKWLERRWRQAEEIAEIADNLFTMPAIENRIAHHKLQS